MTCSEMALLFGGLLAKMNKNILQTGCGKVGSFGLADSAFWHEWSVSGYSSIAFGCITPVLNLTKTLWISAGYHPEASRHGVLKRCTELCYTGNAS